MKQRKVVSSNATKYYGSKNSVYAVLCICDISDVFLCSFHYLFSSNTVSEIDKRAV